LILSTSLSGSKPVFAIVDPSPITKDVSSIYAVGVPGPLLALNNNAIPVVAGDEDTSPSVSTVAIASSLGNGRVVALGHDGFLTNEAIALYDNKKFGDNVIAWLDQQSLKTILITTGHSEWQGGTNSDSFKLELESKGYTVTRYSGSISPSALSGISVVIVGNAWGTITQQEILALQNFVSGGGGLFMMGLGWSWEPYHKGSTLDTNPMNQLGEVFGIRWINGYISDPTNNYQGQPIFHTFYPYIELQTIYQSFDYITSITKAHPKDLPSVLQSDEVVRSKFTRANMLLASSTLDLKQGSNQRGEIYTFYKNLVNDNPQHFKKSVTYDMGSQSAMAWLRERIYRSILNSLLYGDGLTSEKKAEIASIIGLSSKYADVWNNFSVLLLDNNGLDETQKTVIFNYLKQIPAKLHDLHTISVVDYLGSLLPSTPTIDLWGKDDGINIFGIRVGASNENGFPNDVAPKYSDVFTLVLAHEVNHVVDAFYVNNDPALKTPKDALISRAGTNHLNYLRSMFQDGFFTNAPQEFFASIANQWFADSEHTLKLALVKFDKGTSEPLNQFLFYADVYALKGNFTQFYTLDTLGSIEKHSVPVLRDKAGRIYEMVYGSTLYKFTLDQNGYVLSYLTEQFKDTIVIDKAIVSRSRCDVGSTQTIEYHARWLFGGNDVDAITLQINNIDYVTNQTGWVSLKATQDQPKKLEYRVTGVNYEKYNVSVNPVSVTWDKVELKIENQRVDAGSEFNVRYAGWYESNHESFQGSITLNDTLKSQTVGKRGFKVIKITDNKYGLSTFDSNEFQVVFDEIDVKVSIPHNRIDVGKEPAISISGKYEYDSTPFKGQVQLNKPVSTSDVETFKYKILSVTDPLYSLSAFKTGEATCIWDRVKIVDGGASSSSVSVNQPVTVWYKAVYEFDNESFDGSKGSLSVNGEPLMWSSTYQRWEKVFTVSEAKKQSYIVTGMTDTKYGLTVMNDVTKPITVEWTQSGIPGYSIEAILLGMLISITIIFFARDRDHALIEKLISLFLIILKCIPSSLVYLFNKVIIY
jgi:hypothetical protein